jgi:hypothetical protein
MAYPQLRNQPLPPSKLSLNKATTMPTNKILEVELQVNELYNDPDDLDN